MNDAFLSRRGLLGAAAAGLAVLVPLGGGGRAIAVPVGSEAARYLDDRQLATLRAVVDRIVPADLDPGAVAAGCAEAIDALLGAFETDPPRIFAGAPFSDRAGSDVNHFEQFLTLDRYEEMAWRLQIQGSGGNPDLQFNGLVKGFQQIYVDGLAALDEAVLLGRFASATAVERDLILQTSDDPLVKDLLDIAVPHTLQFMYGAPEYGGNAELVGWAYTAFDGDVQPRGWTREEIEERDAASPFDGLELPTVLGTDRLVTALALSNPELVMGLQAASGGKLSGLRERVDSIVSDTLEGVRHGW